MKRCACVFISMLLFPLNQQIFAAQKPQQETPQVVVRQGQELEDKTSSFLPSYVPRGILIFLDDSETKDAPRALSSDIVRAINQKAGPIIASSSLLVNVYGKHEGLNDWVIKKITDFLYLLIPHSYLTALGISKKDAIKWLASGGAAITDVECALGLKVNHMKNAPIALPSKNVNCDYFVDALQRDLIFCSKADYHRYYSEHEKMTREYPFWSVYILGHGSMQSSVAGMSIRGFREFLDFLQTHINTRFLFYESCFAAGLNAELVYKENKNILQKTYLFPIVTTALTDQVVPISWNRNLSELFRYMTPAVSEPIDYQGAVQSIKLKETKNFEHIKLPGLPWFSVFDEEKRVISFGSVLSKSRSAEKALDINTYFNTDDPAVILLYADQIPFEVIMDSPVQFISMIPDEAIHDFKKITYKNGDVLQVVRSFFDNKEIYPRKLFYIQELWVGGSGPYNEVVVVSVVDSDRKYIKKAFYKYQDKLYVVDLTENEAAQFAPATRQQEKIHNLYKKQVAGPTKQRQRSGSLLPQGATKADMQGIEGALEKGKQKRQQETFEPIVLQPRQRKIFSLQQDNVKELGVVKTTSELIVKNIGQLTGPTVIEKLETTNIEATLSMLWMNGAFVNAPIIFIKYMSGRFSPWLQRALGIKSTRGVFRDVIIVRGENDSSYGKTYFTFGGQWYLVEKLERLLWAFFEENDIEKINNFAAGMAYPLLIYVNKMVRLKLPEDRYEIAREVSRFFIFPQENAYYFSVDSNCYRYNMRTKVIEKIEDRCEEKYTGAVKERCSILSFNTSLVPVGEQRLRYEPSIKKLSQDYRGMYLKEFHE